MKKKKYMIILLIIVISCINIGYASISSNMLINGTAIIQNKKWKIYFDNVNINEQSVSAKVEPETVGNNTISIGYEVDLAKPGDFHEFTVDIVNDGDLTAVLDEFSITQLTDAQKKYLNYKVKYNDGNEIAKTDTIAAHSSEKLLVRIEYLKDVTSADLPTADEAISLNVELTYVPESRNSQEGGNTGENPEENPGEKPGENPGETPGSNPGETPGENPSEDSKGSAIADQMVLGYSWTSEGIAADGRKYLVKKTMANRTTTNEPIQVKAGDSFTVKQTSQYIFGYFFTTLEEDGKYYFTHDPGWQTNIKNNDITITAEQDGYLVLNWKKSSNSNLTQEDTDAMKELVTFTSANN